jgi:hypothetical protein
MMISPACCAQAAGFCLQSQCLYSIDFRMAGSANAAGGSPPRHHIYLRCANQHCSCEEDEEHGAEPVDLQAHSNPNNSLPLSEFIAHSTRPQKTTDNTGMSMSHQSLACIITTNLVLQRMAPRKRRGLPAHVLLRSSCCVPHLHL